MDNPILLALIAAFFFACSNLGFAHFAKKTTPIWMTAFKAAIGFVAFGLAAFFGRAHWSYLPDPWSFFAFFLSGLIALNIGDLFLIRALSVIGPSRTMLIFSFQPLYMAFFAYALFRQMITGSQAVAILLMIGCVFFVSYERFRKEKNWEIRGPIYAVIATLLDCVGILLTRYGFDQDRRVSVWEGNFYRCVGAVVGFYLFSHFYRISFWKTYRNFPKKTKVAVITASLMGTFVALSFFLAAVSTGRLAAVSALGASLPVFASVIETAINRKWPSIYFYISFSLFAAGFYLLM